MKEIKFLSNNLIIHRGMCNHKLIENTAPAFIKCIDNNYIIEIDVHMLIDGSIVVYHDFSLFRLCKINKIIESLNCKQLSKIKIKNKYSILTLKQVLSLVSSKVPLIIDVKDLNTDDIFEKKLVKILDKYEGQFAVQSINPLVIEWFLKKRPNYIIGIIINDKLSYKILKKTIKKADFISVNKDMLPLKIKNKLIIGWTINNKNDYEIYNKYCHNLICEKFL